MAASKYDFAIEQGSSFKISMVFKNSDGSLMDLSGWTARLMWKTNTNKTYIFTTTNLDYSVYKFFLDEESSNMVLLIPADTTETFNFSSAKYDLELQSPDNLYSPEGGNYNFRALYGVININKRFSKLDCIS
jgi:hypothetical protein